MKWLLLSPLLPGATRNATVTELVHSRAGFEPRLSNSWGDRLWDVLSRSFQGRVKEKVTLKTNSKTWITNSRKEAGEVFPGVYTKVPQPQKMLSPAQTQAQLCPSQPDRWGVRWAPGLLLCPLLCMKCTPVLFPHNAICLSLTWLFS